MYLLESLKYSYVITGKFQKCIWKFFKNDLKDLKNGFYIHFFLC